MSTKPMTEEELANLSDEDFLNMVEEPQMAAPEPDPAPQDDEPAPAAPGSEEEPQAAEPEEGGEEDAPAGDPDATASGEGDDDKVGDDDAGEKDKQEDEDPSAVLNTPDDDDTPPPSAKKKDEPKADPKAKPQDAAEADKEKGKDKPADALKDGKPADQPVDYKASYERIMAPFKANGKTIKLDSPEEVIQLMQLGANYTKKMQALQPNLKLVKMLDNNGLLDEGKLSFLIDLERKDPAAIQKYLRDANVDPMEIDTTAEPSYQPKNHGVSDQEMSFSSTLEEVASDDKGKDLILEIDRTWDKASKDALWEDPSILSALHEQRSNGMYAQIASEVERQRMLGHHQNVPFIQAYLKVGTALQEAGKLTTSTAAPEPTAQPNPKPAPAAAPEPQAEQQPAPQERRVVAQRTAAPKPAQDDAKVRAATPPKSTPAKPQADFNPLAMSDEEFEQTQTLAMKL